MLGLGLWPRSATRWWPDGAIYAADFTTDRYMINGNAVSRSAAFSFSRASSKLAQDSQGTWHTFAPDVPAITDRGILLEPARQNTVTQSNSLEFWNLLRAAVTANTGPGLLPDNGADLLTATQSNINGAFAGTNAQTVVPGTPYTFSTILRRASTDWVGLVVSTSDNSERRSCWFNLATASTGSTQTVGSDITIHATGIDPLPGDLLRPWVTESTMTVAAPLFRIYLFDNNSSFSVSAGASVSFLQGQVETGEQATSPVVTTMANAARGADVLQITGLTGSFAMNLKYEDGHYEFVDQAASSNISPVLARYLQCFSLTPSP